MRIATYNILKGGSQRVHWVKMIEDNSVDLLLVQESYDHDEHLPPLLYPEARSRSAWEMIGQNGWGSAVYSRSGSVKSIAVGCRRTCCVSSSETGNWRMNRGLLFVRKPGRGFLQPHDPVDSGLVPRGRCREKVEDITALAERPLPADLLEYDKRFGRKTTRRKR